MIWFLFIIHSASFSVYKAEKLETPTYQKEIKSIIDINCTASMCHGAGSKNGDFRTYQGLKKVLQNGKFEKFVIIKRTMPKGKILREEDYNTLKAWVEAGYPQN